MGVRGGSAGSDVGILKSISSFTLKMTQGILNLFVNVHIR